MFLKVQVQCFVKKGFSSNECEGEMGWVDEEGRRRIR
jgi:hypothetical protein